MNTKNVKTGIKIDLKNEKSKKKEYDIYIYVGFKGRRKYFNTGVKCLLKYFNGQFVTGIPFANEYNRKINETYSRVCSLIEATEKEYGSFSIDGLAKVVSFEECREEKRLSLHDNFIEWARREIPNLEVTDATNINNRAALKQLENSNTIRTYKDINEKNIELFDKYIKKQGYSPDTIYKFHSQIRMFIHRAILQGYDIENPYRKFKNKRPKPNKLKYLEEEELEKIVSYSGENSTLNKVRDMFVFQAYTGLSYSDMIRVSKDDIKTVKGKKYIVDKRVKTAQEYSIRLYKESEEILDRYGYNMNLFANQSYNRFLKSLAIVTGVRQDLTSHMARHTFATIALNRGVPLPIVARMLGHSTTKCTEIYAQYLQKTIEQNGYDLLEDIFGK